MITGACLCGDVAYAIDGRISPIWLCHCSKCRRANGAAFHASAICRPSQFRWLSGSDKIAGYEDTKTYKVRFCERCGSPVPSHIEEFDFVSLPAGGLNGDPARGISHHIFVDSKAPWYEITDEHPQHAEHAPRKG